MKKKNLIPYMIIFISIMFIVYGIYKGELTSILNKSIHICMECIGIG